VGSGGPIGGMPQGPGRSDASGLPPLVEFGLGEPTFLAQAGDGTRIITAPEHQAQLLLSVQRLARADRAGRRQVAADQASASERRGGDDHRGADENDVLEDILSLQRRAPRR